MNSTEAQTRFDSFCDSLKKEIFGFGIRFKDESRLMRIIGKLLFFNKSFMTSYTTTTFSKVYFPNRKRFEERGPDAAYITLRHEAIHLRDSRKFFLFFQLSYIFLLPAILTFRAFWEWRGYKESIRAYYEVYGVIPDSRVESIVNNFVGSSYLYMFPFRKFLTRRFNKFIRESVFH